MKLSGDQAVPALIAALVSAGVAPDVIEAAVGRVMDLELGESSTLDNPLLRAFANEQAARFIAPPLGVVVEQVATLSGMFGEPGAAPGAVAFAPSPDPAIRVKGHTPLERAVVSRTEDLWRAFLGLELSEDVSHPSHRPDVADAIHAVQRIVALRLARRVDPDTWAGGEPDV